jgi:hypothetical protein
VCNPRRSQLAPQYSRALLPNHPGDDPSSRPRIRAPLILSHLQSGDYPRLRSWDSTLAQAFSAYATGAKKSISSWLTRSASS